MIYSKGPELRTQLLLHKCRTFQAEELQVGFGSAAADFAPVCPEKAGLRAH
jgi:hypothetical protein